MKTSKRKRSAKTASAPEAPVADVIAAEMPAAVEPAAEACVELTEAAVEALVAEPTIETVETIVLEAAAESVVEEAVAAEPVADAVEIVVSEAAAEPVVATEEAVAAEVAAEPAPVGEPIVVLNSNCSVKDAAALKASLLSFAQHSDAVTVDVSAVERVDTATMQLLCAFVRDRGGRNQGVSWRGESQALRDAVRLLGVSALLGFETKGVAA